ncbi:uncharacterized protein LOC143567009 [Bidens hawaiensis]|uniref:uncharacterized protein LOC143567009 n=1 Tax=Bidens hawaiensis TaxID=980011 RepID=UPI00404B10A2
MLKKGLWSPEEDAKLFNYISTHGRDRHWSSIAKLAGLSRSSKSCRLRWLNHLQPGLKRRNFSSEEVKLIINLHNNMGNKYKMQFLAEIAKHLPGRTDSSVKNLWNSNIKKKLLVANPKNNKTNDTPDHDHSQTIDSQNLQINAPWSLVKHGQEFETCLDIDLPPLPPSFMGDSCQVIDHHLLDNTNSSIGQNWDPNHHTMQLDQSEMNNMGLIIDSQPNIQLFNVALDHHLTNHFDSSLGQNWDLNHWMIQYEPSDRDSLYGFDC